MTDHTCINHFGKIQTIVTEASTYWVIREYATCKKCYKNYEHFKNKLQKTKTLNGCQLYAPEWKEL